MFSIQAHRKRSGLAVSFDCIFCHRIAVALLFPLPTIGASFGCLQFSIFVCASIRFANNYVVYMFANVFPLFAFISMRCFRRRIKTDVIDEEKSTHNNYNNINTNTNNTNKRGKQLWYHPCIQWWIDKMIILRASKTMGCDLKLLWTGFQSLFRQYSESSRNLGGKGAADQRNNGNNIALK